MNKKLILGDSFMKTAKKYTFSFDCISKHRSVLMGLAILSIIIFHFTEDCVNSGYNLFPLVKLYKAGVGSCGVDVFLFLSGLGLYYSFKKNSDIKTFYSKRFTRILIPYFCVAIPAWLINDIIIYGAGVKQALKDIFFISFFQSGTIWFWYILMMLFCYIIFPFVFDYVDGPNSKTKMLQIFVFITVITLLLQACSFDFFMRINIALARFPAFFLGCFIGKASYEKKPILYGTYSLLLLAIFLLPLKSICSTPLSRYILGAFGIAIFILIAVFLEILETHNIKLGIIKRIIVWFGNYSLELYLTHVAIRSFMFHFGLPPYRFRYELLLVLLSIATSIIIKRITNKIAQIIK